MSLSTVQTCPVNQASHWLQSASCGMRQPTTVSPVLMHAAYVGGYWFIPAILVLAVVAAITIAVRRGAAARPARASR
jgi:hypothetical protein